ncbi:MAG TPA: hypothetical protein VFW48_05040 [Solirubrobacterales bacterium]|nr:hypothetical protein [Solirubrobacterales bacterium]
MRDKLNSSPVAQVALIGVLLVAVAIFFMKPMGGDEEGEEASSGDVAATVNGVGATGSSPGEAVESTLEAGATASTAVPSPPMATSPPPAAVVDAYESGSTVVLLIVHDGGIDDRLVRDASDRLGSLSGVSTFVVPAAKIARYAAITEGVGVERVPALVVVRPKRLEGSVPTASVSYGFQSGASVVQAVIDAGYEGPTVDYHP